MSKPERARRGEDARVDLKETAIDCFARYGYQGTSIDRIAREAGVTKGAIYYHYKDKNDLLLAAVADRIKAFEHRVETACQGVPPSEALRRVAAVSIDHAVSTDRPRFALKMMVEAIDTHDSVLEQMRGMMRRYRAFVRNIIRSGQASGDFRADADAEMLAATLISAIIGAETQYHLDPDRFRIRQTLATFVDQLCDDLRATDGAETRHVPSESQGRPQP